MVKEQIRNICTNKIITQLDKAFNNNPDGLSSFIVIFSQSSLKNVKK